MKNLLCSVRMQYGWILHSSFFTLNYLKNMYLFRNKFVALLLVITPKSFWPMKKLSSLFSLFLLIPLFAVASEVGDRTIPAEVAQLADSLKQKFAPDKRVCSMWITLSPERMWCCVVSPLRQRQRRLCWMVWQRKDMRWWIVCKCFRMRPDLKARRMALSMCLCAIFG